MKKLLTAILALSLLLSLCACTDGSAETTTQSTTSAPEPTTEETLPVSSPEQLPMAAISLPAVTETTEAEDGTVLFRYTYQSMSLVMPDQEVADAIIIDYLSHLDTAALSAQSLAQSAKSSYTGGSWTPYFNDVLYSPTRIDHNVLSLYGENVSWSGASHPTRTCITANYDMVTGDRLTLGSILYDATALETLCDLVVQQLDAIAEEKNLTSKYGLTVKNLLSTDESHYEAWYFTGTGLVFCFSPYELAPYASGVIAAEVPYEKLTGVIDDAYFPVEQDAAAGSLNTALLTEENADSFSQIAEIILDTEGQMIFLYTEDSVLDVKLEIGTMNASGDSFIRNYTGFAAPYLTPGDAIMLQHSFGEEAVIQVQYYSNNQKFNGYLILENDTVLLKEEPHTSVS